MKWWMWGTRKYISDNLLCPVHANMHIKCTKHFFYFSGCIIKPLHTLM